MSHRQGQQQHQTARSRSPLPSASPSQLTPPISTSNRRLAAKSSSSKVTGSRGMPQPRSSSNRSPPSPLGSPSSPSNRCDVCERIGLRVWTCIQCNNDLFCEECWSKERAHRPGAVGFDGKPHEKTDREVVERLRSILEPTCTEEQQLERHREDEDTTWFGIAKDPSGLPVFQDYERYAAIMEQSRSAEAMVRYPQLVSFIGQTGAGKSTLIKMLINHKEDSSVSSSERFPSPVSGNINDNVPTTGDVHLYSDPASYRSAIPMLYADCEGLEGGENIPRGARFRQRDGPTSPTMKPAAPLDPNKLEVKSRKLAHNAQRDLSWATTPETRKREYAVTQLYPRLLYTFSDVVVFVLRNSKIFESVVLEKLLDWASASIERSLNQPALPHMIIALNASDLSLDEKQWGVEDATRILMADIEGAISRVPRFQEYANLWREAGREIKTTKDLLECYYSSVTVVRIPAQGRYMLMNEQISKLHFEIKKCCQVSYWTKKRVRMLSSDEKLQVFLQSAFDHFSQNLNAPFDFVKEAVKNNPIPRDFGGNILKLAIAVRDHNCFHEQYDGQRIWLAMSQMVASCLMLNSARQSLLGSVIQLLDDVYADVCDEALESFCNLYWPCSFSNEHGKCCNMRSGHNPKGHQNAAGKILAVGAYRSSLDFDSYADVWINNISYYLEKIQKEVYAASIRDDSLTESEAATKVHCKTMNEFYRNVGDNVFQFVSHSTCFSCLRELPEHPLPCGHVLCTACVKSYGSQVERSVYQLGFCPMHVMETEFVAEFPWKVRIKPLFAGTRVLSLDGGGVKGIAQLEVLKAIEVQLGGELPIQGFFDLIVGTGTGGVIALGLGIENWSTETCVTNFAKFCEQAYSPREFAGVPLLGKLSAVHHRSMYKTRPLEKSLLKIFEQRPLFGGLNSQDRHMVKVAVTATTLIGQRPVVLANYNRPDGSNHSKYIFERQDDPSMEMRTWEAARASSATCPHFKSFTKDTTKISYTDASLYHSNPVAVAHQERRLIWKDVALKPPDLFLSIGTGVHISQPHSVTPPSSTRSTTSHSQRSRGDEQSIRKNIMGISNKNKAWTTPPPQSDGTSQCTRQWVAFNQDVLGGRQYKFYHRYMRLDPDLGFPAPKPDAVGELSRVQQAAATNSRVESNAKIREIAHRLVASSFFFEKVEASVSEMEDGTWECDGSICCRFSKGSNEMRALGRFMKTLTTPNFQPYFMIQEEGNLSNTHTIPISEDVVIRMCERGRFNLDMMHLGVSKQLSITNVYICLQSAPYGRESGVGGGVDLPISGFPRSLMVESLSEKTLQAQPQHTLPRTSVSFKGRHRRRRNGTAASFSPNHATELRLVKTITPTPPHSSGQDSGVSIKAKTKTAHTHNTPASVPTSLYPLLLGSTKRHSASSNADTAADGRLSLRHHRAETSPFPDSPEDVSRWMERRREKLRFEAMGDVHPGNKVEFVRDEDEEIGELDASAEIPRLGTPVCELDDTSLSLSPSGSGAGSGTMTGTVTRANSVLADGMSSVVLESVAMKVLVGREVGGERGKEGERDKKKRLDSLEVKPMEFRKKKVPGGEW